MEVQQLSLQILVIHNEIISRNVVIGEVMVPLASLDLAGGEAQIWRDIKPYHFQNVRTDFEWCFIHKLSHFDRPIRFSQSYIQMAKKIYRDARD